MTGLPLSYQSDITVEIAYTLVLVLSMRHRHFADVVLYSNNFKIAITGLGVGQAMPTVYPELVAMEGQTQDNNPPPSLLASSPLHGRGEMCQEQ